MSAKKAKVHEIKTKYYAPLNGIKYDNVQNENTGVYRYWAAVTQFSNRLKLVGYHSETYYWEGTGWENDAVGHTYYEEVPKGFYDRWKEVKSEECSNFNDVFSFKIKEDDSSSIDVKKLSFEDFWKYFSDNSLENKHKENFKKFLDIKVHTDYNYNTWYNYYIDYLVQDKHEDISTKIYNPVALDKYFSYQVYQDMEDDHYFVLENPTAILNNWVYIRRFKNKEYAASFCKANNKDNKSEMKKFIIPLSKVMSPKKLTIPEKMQEVYDIYKKEFEEHIKNNEKTFTMQINVPWTTLAPSVLGLPEDASLEDIDVARDAYGDYDVAIITRDMTHKIADSLEELFKTKKEYTWKLTDLFTYSFTYSKKPDIKSIHKIIHDWVPKG